MWVDPKSEVTAMAKHQVMKAYMGLNQNILIFLTLELNYMGMSDQPNVSAAVHPEPMG
jgi:hypothetical protein